MVVPSLANSGPIVVARDIIEALHGDVDFEVFFFKDSDDCLDFEVPTHRIGLFDLEALERFDIVHAHELRPEMLLLLGQRKLQRAGVRTMSTVHAFLPVALRMNYGALWQALVWPVWRRALQGHDRVVTLSASMESFYSDAGLDDARLVTIRNGRRMPPDATRLSADMTNWLDELSERYRIIGSVGRLDPVKGFDQVIRCLPENPDWAFVLIGAGRERDALLQLARELGVADRTHLLGYRRDAAAWYPRFDVYAMVSHHEGLPLVLLEAAMHATPTVCTRLPTMTEFFSEEEVVYYRPRDLDDLAHAIGEACETGATFGRKMHERYLSDYTTARMGDAYLTEYRRLTDGDAGG